MVIKEDVIVTKELLANNIWVDGTRNQTDTAADIYFSGSNLGTSTIFIGRQSLSGATTMIWRGRTSVNGMCFSPGNGLVIDNHAVPTTSSINANSILQLNATNKALVVPRMTTAQATTLSGSGVLSGAIIYNLSTGKLQVYTAAAGLGGKWEDLN